MQDKLNQFILNLQGQFVEVSDRTNIYQCMDLAYLWVYCLGYPKATISHLYASQVYTQPTELTRQYFDLLSNTATFIPQDGDLSVFTNKVLINGVYVDVGHIGVTLSGGTTSNFRNFEQNWPIGTNAFVRFRDYNSPKLLGVLRPKVFTTSPAPVPSVVTDPSTKLDFQNMTTQIETYAIIDFGTTKAKLSAKDQEISNLRGKIQAAKNALG